MPEMIPRTEYSANEHWPLIKAVTGIDVDAYSISEKKQLASSEFLKAWDYGMFWNIYHINDLWKFSYSHGSRRICLKRH
jgi:hypothetical protein